MRIRFFKPLLAKIACSFIVIALISAPVSGFARTTSSTHGKHKAHHKKRHARAGVDRSAAYSDIVINADTGEILHETDSDGMRHPASLTKMMTLYLTFQALESGKLKMNQYLPVSLNAAEQAPSKLGLRAGQRIRVEDAILGIVTESANDAAMAVGEWVGGNENAFAQMMTRQAHALGMTHTNFENPNGLPDPEQVTTARDMAILGQALLYHFPKYYGYFSRDSFTYAGINHPNHNHLMQRYDGMDGIKTGYIRASGFNLVASVKRNDVRLIGVVFGGKSALARDNRMAVLLDQAFADIADDEKASTPVAHATMPAASKEPPSEQVAAEQMRAPEVTPQGDGVDENNDDSNPDYVALPSRGGAQDEVARKLAMASPPKASDLGGTNWGVQIGAYTSKKAADRAVASLVRSMPQLLGSGTPAVEKMGKGRKAMYRARLMTLDPKTAQTVCAYMASQKKKCLTVGP